MPSTYSPDLRVELIANGEKTGTWGTITNSNLGTILEDAISGLATVSIISSAQALTVQDGSPDEARNAAVTVTTTTAANFSVFVPPVTKLYTFTNASAYVATVYASTVAGNTTAAGTGVAIPAGKSILVRCDGTNIVEQLNHVVGALGVGGALTIGGTGAFTGAVSGPTAAPGTNTTQLATTAFVLANGIPSGVITLWSGSIVSIPSGWLICDGTSGTPDLRNRFVVGAGSTYAVAATGGSADAITVSHTHTATSTVTDPGHNHGLVSSAFPDTFNSSQVAAGVQVTGQFGARNFIQTTGVTVATTNASTGASGTNANLPPYYALAYIMKA
jgi:hypothetical protein